jgi:hypothetical protein
MIRFVSCLFLAGMTLNASAQSNTAPDVIALDKGVRVQSSLNYSVPLTSNDVDEIFKAQDALRLRLYAVADKECALLAQTIASVCRLENVNVNVHRQRQTNADTINATLTMSFRVLLKP